MVEFFRRAFELHGGEAVLLLLHHPKERRFRWLCPWQTVDLWRQGTGGWRSSCSIEYEEPPRLPPGFVVAGDAHSHGRMAAYASSLDIVEERYKDGLHIVVGHIDRTEVDVSIDFCMDGCRFAVPPSQLFDDRTFLPLRRVPEEWLGRIRIRRRGESHHLPPARGRDERT